MGIKLFRYGVESSGNMQRFAPLEYRQHSVNMGGKGPFWLQQ